MAFEIISKGAPAYLPLAIGIKVLKDAAEDGKELPKPLQLIDCVGAGMVAGIGLSPGLYGARFLKAVKQEKLPNGTISQSINQLVQNRGLRPSFHSCASHMFAKGAVVGVAYFAADQMYKHYSKKD